MDPQDPSTFNHRTERLATGRTYHFVDQVPTNYDAASTSTLLCVHGFPDLWYGWRYQIGPWTRRGFRVVVPDMLGYGGTDKPTDAAEYSTKRLCADLAALMDLIGIQKAVLIGHDWGSFTVGRFALWYPQRLLSLVIMCVPYTPPARRYIPLEEVVKRVPNLGYQAYFADPSSTAQIEANLLKFLKVIYQAPSNAGEQVSYLGQMQQLLESGIDADSSTCVLSDNELKYYHQEFKQGMLGPLSYYRTSRHRYEEESTVKLPSTLSSDLPALFIWGTEDPTATPIQVRASHKFVPRLRDIALQGRGHWIMVEEKDKVTDIVLQFLETTVSTTPTKGKL